MRKINYFLYAALLLVIIVPVSTSTRSVKRFNRNVSVEKLLTACKLKVNRDAVIRGNLCVDGVICNNAINNEIQKCCDSINNNINFTRETILEAIDTIPTVSCCETIGTVDATIDCTAIDTILTCTAINDTDYNVIQWLKAIFYVVNHLD